MDPEPHVLVTDSLLLDTSQALDSIAARLGGIHDTLRALGADPHTSLLLVHVIVDLGWWSGRLHGSVSPETAEALHHLADDEPG